jgi:hypothetical protein
MTGRAVSLGLTCAWMLAFAVQCETPPVGWQGAGRNQMLPLPIADASTASPGDDSGDPDDSGEEAPTEPESGPETGPVDAHPQPSDACGQDAHCG